MQTLSLVNDSFKSMIDAYEDTFTDEVWEVKHKTVWPLLEEDSARNVYYRKKMAALRKRFNVEMENLRTIMKENEDRRQEIKTLREELYTGTSIQESRKSVENTEITIQQGHNIKLLTMVSIFFLRLTFVTSVFGMINMPTNGHFWRFGIVTVAICIPFFLLLGSLNTTRGMLFWQHKVAVATKSVGSFFRWIGRCGSPNPKESGNDKQYQDDSLQGVPMSRSTSARDERAMRTRMWSRQGLERSRESLEMNGTNGKDAKDAETPTSPRVAPTMPRLAEPRRSSTLADMMAKEHLERRRTLKYDV